MPYFLCCAFQNLQLFSWFTCDCLTTTWEPREGGTMWASFTSGPQPGTWSNNRGLVTTARVKMGLAGAWAVCGLSIPLVFKPRKAAFWRCPCKLSANLCAPQKGRQAAKLCCPGAERSSWCHTGTSAGFPRSPPKHIFCSEMTIPG